MSVGGSAEVESEWKAIHILMKGGHGCIMKELAIATTPVTPVEKDCNSAEKI